MEIDERIELAASLLRNAHHAIALTGAGSSTPSGIPDFRSSGSGLWEKYDPFEVASITTFRHRPEAFYRWVQPMVKQIREAEPNAGHIALAQMENHGIIKAILTQNIDNLHQRAGAQNVLELHGHLREVTCLNCFRVAPAEEALEAALSGTVPRCTHCGGVVKPNVILFGEQLPSQVFIKAMEHTRRADLVLVVGSSLSVVPVAKIPAVVHSHGGQVIIVNNQPTYADDFAAVVFGEDLAEALPLLAQAVLENET